MPIIVLTILIQAAFIIHVVKTGRNTIWIWIVAFLSMAGVLAYLVVEILPELMGSRTARRAASDVRRTLDPQRDLRNAKLQLRVTDSIDSRRRVADQLFATGEYRDAMDHYRSVLTGLYEHDPLLLQGLARAQFALGEFTAARESLDRLIEHNPDFKSPEGHLLYARALMEEGSLEKAAAEFAVVVRGFPGAEAKYRHALLLRRMGQEAQAREVLRQLLSDAELAGKHYRKEQKQWLDLARREAN